MFSLLNPAALWTLAALAVPLAIHLRHPPPRTVRLGSLRSLESVTRRPWHRPRWRELLLLWIRSGLLLVLTLLLAGLHWTTTPPAGPRRWALLDPNAVLTGDARARWQALRTAGYEVRRLAPGFPAMPGEPTNDADAPAPDLWSLLREADAELPRGSAVAVFSSDRLAALRGVRPALANCQIEWCTAPGPAAEATHTWTMSDAGRPLSGRSDARATTLTPQPSAKLPAVRATSVLILHDAACATDAQYVEAAVRAAADSLARPVNLQRRVITADAENAAATDWMFWLSTGPIPAGLAGRARRIVRYAPGDAVAADGFIVALVGDAADGVPLRRRASPAVPAPAATAFWTDGQGNPLLTYSHPTGANETWELSTRFDPDWNDLPRSAALAGWVRSLLCADASAPLLATDPLHDRRTVDPSQGPPSQEPAPPPAALALADQPTLDLHWPLWTLAAALFAAERVLSLRRFVRPTSPAQRPPTLAVSPR